MFARLSVTGLFAAICFSAHAAPSWVALDKSMGDSSFVDIESVERHDQYVEVAVLRSFGQTISLGTDPVSGNEVYPHRSVKVHYAVACARGELAMTEWKMYDGSLGNGDVVWAERTYGELAFSSASDEESRQVLQTVCSTETAAR